jgi:hypothetical protein
MSKAVDEILNSIVKDFADCRQGIEEAEAKALYRLLNYCPPGEPVIAIPAEENLPQPLK